MVLGLTVGSVSMGAITIALVPSDFRGRVSGITKSLSVVTIPISTLLAGLLAELFGVVPLYCFGGIWILCVGVFAWSKVVIRKARIVESSADISN